MVERAYAMSSNQWHTFFALYTHIQFRLRSFSISIAVDRAFVALFCFLIYERQTSYNFQPSKSYLLNFEKVCEKKYICMKCRRLKELKSPFAWDEHAAGLDFGSFSFRKTIMDRKLVIHTQTHKRTINYLWKRRTFTIKNESLNCFGCLSIYTFKTLFWGVSDGNIPGKIEAFYLSLHFL